MWTMLEGFQHLSGEEIDALIQAPALITVLIGAADGKLDREERGWSERLMQARTYSKPHLVNEFYRIAAENFGDKLDQILDDFPSDTDARNEEIAIRLGALNPILAKLDAHLGATLYKSFVVLAKETAKASGGFLRIGSVSAAEHKWMKLPMLTPVLDSGDGEE